MKNFFKNEFFVEFACKMNIFWFFQSNSGTVQDRKILSSYSNSAWKTTIKWLSKKIFRSSLKKKIFFFQIFFSILSDNQWKFLKIQFNSVTIRAVKILNIYSDSTRKTESNWISKMIFNCNFFTKKKNFFLIEIRWNLDKNSFFFNMPNIDSYFRCIFQFIIDNWVEYNNEI